MNDKVNQLLEDLQEKMNEGIPVVVEGKNDKKALRQIGLEGTIYTLSSTSMNGLAEVISRKNKKVIILTDLDDFGEKAAKKLRDFFLNEAVKPNLVFRTRFRKLLGVTCFEDMPTLLEKEKNI